MLVRPIAHQDGHPGIRLLIVDDHVAVRQGLQQMFGIVPGVDVVGVAADGREAVSQAGQLRPDVVLMDLEMPKLDGIEATRLITTAYPASRVVILSGSVDQARIRDALEAGALGYVPKHSDPGQVVRAVQDAYLGPPDRTLATSRAETA